MSCNIGRIAYDVWLLDQITQRKPADVELNVMYDIACTLVLHLKAKYGFHISGFVELHFVQKNDPKSKLLLTKFAIPAFHAFAHNPSCQVCKSSMKHRS